MFNQNKSLECGWSYRIISYRKLSRYSSACIVNQHYVVCTSLVPSFLVSLTCSFCQQQTSVVFLSHVFNSPQINCLPSNWKRVTRIVMMSFNHLLFSEWSFFPNGSDQTLPTDLFRWSIFNLIGPLFRLFVSVSTQLLLRTSQKLWFCN